MSPSAIHRAYVGLGANLGDAQGAVLAAIDRLTALGLFAASSLYRSAPVDAVGPPFVNAVAALNTPLDAAGLLAELQAIENDFGRLRPYRHAPRTLDLDLLLHGRTVCSGPLLTLPHPRLHLRAFVLHPLLELAPDLDLPGLGPLSSHLPATALQPLVRLQGPPTMNR